MGKEAKVTWVTCPQFEGIDAPSRRAFPYVDVCQPPGLQFPRQALRKRPLPDQSRKGNRADLVFWFGVGSIRKKQTSHANRCTDDDPEQ